MSQLQLGDMRSTIAFFQECRHGSLFARALLAVLSQAWRNLCVGQGDLFAQLMDCVSGRADYFGLAVNRAARFLGAACGGQVLAERGLVEEVVQYWHSLVYK